MLWSLSPSWMLSEEGCGQIFAEVPVRNCRSPRRGRQQILQPRNACHYAPSCHDFPRDVEAIKISARMIFANWSMSNPSAATHRSPLFPHRAHACANINPDLLGAAFRYCGRNLRPSHRFKILQQRRWDEPRTRRINMPIALQALSVRVKP